MKTIVTTSIFDRWFDGLKNRTDKARIEVRIRRAESDNFSDVKPVGEGVSEMRIHCSSGYRVYFMQRGLELVIFLAGGDKSTQQKDIKAALNLANELED